jgi:hypothetical protein
MVAMRNALAIVLGVSLTAGSAEAAELDRIEAAQPGGTGKV